MFAGRYWAAQALEAERGLLDFVTIGDAFGIQTDSPGSFEPSTDPGRLRGRLDAALIASWLAARTEQLGIVPTITTTHTEPFHVSKSVATLDHISGGRAGWRAQVSASPSEAAHFGRRPELAEREIDLSQPRADLQALIGELFGEAREVIDVVRRLWDSWGDDAEIRDAATGRFVDREKLHYVDFTGSHFSVKGPSITPRPPQGQPVVTVLAHSEVPYQLAATSADLVYVTPSSDDQARATLARIREIETETGRTGAPLKVFADVEVVLSTGQVTGAERLAALNELAGAEFSSDALILTGDVAEVVDLITGWHRLGYAGVRLRPAENAVDLPLITREVVPALQAAGVFRTDYGHGTLRDRLNLPAAANRYAAA